MGMTNSNVGGSDGSMVSVVVNGVGLMVPVGLCASFGAFAAYVAQNSTQTVDVVNDKGAWVNSMAGYGITMI